MENDNLMLRVQRLYASIKAIIETDISKFKPSIISNNHRTGFYHDWTGNLTEAERTNYVQSLISNIASFEYQLYKWADDYAHDKTIVKNTFDHSKALQIIHDLWNTDKHAGSSRISRSGLWPTLKEINSSLQLSTKPEKGPSIGLTFNANGTPKILGNGTARVVISADVLDKEGNIVADFYKIALDAVAAWETVLRNFDVNIE